MRKFLVMAMLWLAFSPATAFAQSSDAMVPDATFFNRSLNRKFLSIVFYNDGTYERRASFYPTKGKKHWATVNGKWTRQADGRLCLSQSATYFHDPNSTRVFSDGGCLKVYKNSRGQVRVEMKHKPQGGFDGPVKVVAANDGFHFPSKRALKVSGAKQITPASFFKAAQGRKYVVNQWVGRINFVPANKKVFEMSQIQNGSAVVHDRRGKMANAKITTTGQSMCTEFTYPRLWAKGCGTIWQTPDGRLYVVSDESGYAYMGGQLQ